MRNIFFNKQDEPVRDWEGPKFDVLGLGVSQIAQVGNVILRIGEYPD